MGFQEENRKIGEKGVVEEIIQENFREVKDTNLSKFSTYPDLCLKLELGHRKVGSYPAQDSCPGLPALSGEGNFCFLASQS